MSKESYECETEGVDCCASLGESGASAWVSRARRIFFALLLLAAAGVVLYDLAAADDESVVCGQNLDSIKSLDKLAQGKDVAFIFLPGEKEKANREVSAELEALVKKLGDSGKKVIAFTMKQDSPDRASLMRMFSVKSLPSVAVLGRGCMSTAISGDIDEDRLLRAYEYAIIPRGLCGGRGCGSGGGGCGGR